MPRTGKYVRFEDWKSENSVNISVSQEKEGILGAVSDFVSRGLKYLRSKFSLESPDKAHAKQRGSKGAVLDPQGPFLQRWNKIFVVSCVVAAAVDPLFFYLPEINPNETCVYLDKNLEIVASCLRFFTDFFYVLHIIFQFGTGFVAPSKVYGRSVLVEDRRAIAKQYMSTYFWIDAFAVLPLPQVIVLIILPRLTGQAVLNAKNALLLIVIFQYAPRLLRIIPLYNQVKRSVGVIAESAWVGAALNLLLYFVASHVYGALWYLLSVQREYSCWIQTCESNNCNSSSLICEGNSGNNNQSLFANACPTVPGISANERFGIYLPVLQNAVETSFFDKFFYCFWWGLQNLSSLGQNLRTSTYTWENVFAISVAIVGLILFALLIGNMQTYLQSNSLRTEEMRVRMKDADQWMTYRMLPDNIRERIKRHEQYMWHETRGVDEERLLLNLPKDLRREIKRHLCLSLVTRVPMFEKMDDQLLDAMCNRLKPALYTKSSCIIREGDPVNEMLFIMRGDLESTTTNGGRTGFFNSNILKAGDFCGEELVTWALDPHSSSSLPSSTRTVKAFTEVEAFVLMANDMKFVTIQFRRLQSRQLQHTFRFYSQQWRTWAACFIQVAWRRYCRRKLEYSLYEKEMRLQAVLVGDGFSSTSSLGAALYASRFAGNLLRALRRNELRRARLQEQLPSRFLEKPAEPDFSAD